MYRSVLFVDLQHEKNSANLSPRSSSLAKNQQLTLSDSNPSISPRHKSAHRKLSLGSQMSDFVNLNLNSDYDVIPAFANENTSPDVQESSLPNVKKHVTFKIDESNQKHSKKDYRNNSLPRSYHFSEAIVSPAIINGTVAFPAYRKPLVVLDRFSPVTVKTPSNAHGRVPLGWYSQTKIHSHSPLGFTDVKTSIDRSTSPIISSRNEPDPYLTRDLYSPYSNYNTNHTLPTSKRPSTNLGKITESVTKMSFDEDFKSNKNKFRPLCSKSRQISTPTFYGLLEMDSSSENELPRINAARTWRTPSPKPIGSNPRVSGHDSSRTGSQKDVKSDESDYGSMRTSSSLGFRPLAPLRVVTPTFENPINATRRIRTAIPKRESSFVALSDTSKEIIEGIESRPRCRNYSFVNRPAISGQTEVFFRKSEDGRYHRSSSTRTKRKSANIDSLCTSDSFMDMESRNFQHGNSERLLYSSSTDIQNSPDSSASPNYASDNSQNQPVKSPNYDMLLKKAEQSAFKKPEIKQSFHPRSLKDDGLYVRLKYIVLQESITGCSPLIEGEEKLAEFFLLHSTLGEQNGSPKGKIQHRRDDSDNIYFNYQVLLGKSKISVDLYPVLMTFSWVTLGNLCNAITNAAMENRNHNRIFLILDARKEAHVNSFRTFLDKVLEYKGHVFYTYKCSSQYTTVKDLVKRHVARLVSKDIESWFVSQLLQSPLENISYADV